MRIYSIRLSSFFLCPLLLEKEQNLWLINEPIPFAFLLAIVHWQLKL